jgi:hypothetical protein
MKQMRKKLLLVGILAVTLSTISATQYVRADLGFSYEIVHPSESDIRYIGYDLAGDDKTVLRSYDDSTATLYFGRWSTNQTKTYTAAVGIVNEEPFPIEITGVKVFTPGIASIQIWLHGDESMNAEDSGGILMHDSDSPLTPPAGTWTLAAGNMDYTDMSDGVNPPVLTGWCTKGSKVRVADSAPLAQTTVADYVWVQIVLTVPENLDIADLDLYTGSIQFDFSSL